MGRMTIRHCPVCGGRIAVRDGRGRPRIYCGDACRWKRGHALARERAREQWRAAMAMTDDELAARLSALPGALA